MTQQKRQRIVVKVGTSTLTKSSQHLDKASMLELVRALAKLQLQGNEIILVSSGAVAAGREVLSDPVLPKTLSSKQMLASVGQGHLMAVYDSLFSLYDIKIGQMLLTRADLENRERFLNAQDLINNLIEHKIIPIINENDAVSISEIKIGDNDNIAAITGILANADKVILLTDQKGLFDKDPRTNADAKLITNVEIINEHIFALAGGAGSFLGTGGMYTKIKAAKKCVNAGIEMIIASGNDFDNLSKLVDGYGIGTYFKAATTIPLARKTWLEVATVDKGELLIDEGAKQALIHKGSSLLPSGIIGIEGNFERGAMVAIIDANQHLIGRGLCRYNADDIKRIKGLKSEQIEKVLGFSHGNVIIHRDDLIIEKD